MTTTHMTRRDVERVVQEARERGETPDLCGVDLRWIDLHELDLTGANLYRANLIGTKMHGAVLRWANLIGTKMRWADPTGADLTGADLRESDLRESNLIGADLHGAVLTGANLHGVAGIIGLGHTPSGPAHMVPLPNGTWRLSVGCWDGTTAELRTLIAGDDWPEAVGVEQDRRRPILTTLADHADNLAAYHHEWLDAVVKRWGDKETTR